MAEWLKAHDSKSCMQKCIGGSNPLASAKSYINSKRRFEIMYDTLSLMQAMETIATNKVEEFYSDALDRQDPIWAVTAQETLAKRGNYEEIVRCLLKHKGLVADNALTEAIIGSFSRMRNRSGALYYFSKKASEEIRRGRISALDTAEIFGMVVDEKVGYFDQELLITKMKEKNLL